MKEFLLFWVHKKGWNSIFISSFDRWSYFSFSIILTMHVSLFFSEDEKCFSPSIQNHTNSIKISWNNFNLRRFINESFKYSTKIKLKRSFSKATTKQNHFRMFSLLQISRYSLQNVQVHLSTFYSQFPRITRKFQ